MRSRDSRMLPHIHRAMLRLFSLFQNSPGKLRLVILPGFASLLPFVPRGTQRNAGRDAQDHRGNHLQIAIEVCSRPKLLLEFFRCRRDKWKHKSPQAKAGVLQVSRVRSRTGWKIFLAGGMSFKTELPSPGLSDRRPTGSEG